MAIELHHLHPGHDDDLSRLKARIAELEKENAELKEQYRDMDVTHTVHIAKMNALIEELEESQRWRKFSEEKPEVNQDVLVADAFGLEDSVTMARYTKEGWELNNGSLIKKGWFKFWRELPKAPEDK